MNNESIYAIMRIVADAIKDYDYKLEGYIIFFEGMSHDHHTKTYIASITVLDESLMITDYKDEFRWNRSFIPLSDPQFLKELRKQLEMKRLPVKKGLTDEPV